MAKDVKKEFTGPQAMRRAERRAGEAERLGLDGRSMFLDEPAPESNIFASMGLALTKKLDATRKERNNDESVRLRNPLNSDKAVDIIQFCEDPDYMGIKLLSKFDYPEFQGPISQKELLWKFCMEKDDAGMRSWNELVLTIGMRGTKTTTVSLIELYELYDLLRRPTPQLDYGVLPRQEIFLTNVAGSQTQSQDTVFAKIEEFLPNSPWFQKYIAYLKECGNNIEGNPYYRAIDVEYAFRDKNITVRAMNSNSASQVGKTSKIVVFDELARMKTTEGALAGGAVYSSLSKATQTFGENGIKISCSSPWIEGDQMWELNKLNGKIKKLLVYHLPTWMFNPKISRESLEGEYTKNPEDSDRDFGAIWPKSEEDAVDMKELVDAVIKPWRKPLLKWHQKIDERKDADGVTRKYVQIEIEQWPTLEKSTMRVLHGDPGKSDDSYAICIEHIEMKRGEGGRIIPIVVNDLTLEWMPNPQIKSIVDYMNVGEIILKLWQTLNIINVSFDQWNSEATIQWLRQMGVSANEMKFTENQQMAMFNTTKQLIYAGQFESYPGDEKTCEQFKALKKVGNRIDHPKTGKITDKDRSDCWMVCAFKLVEKLAITGPTPGPRAKPRMSSGGALDTPRTSRLSGARLS